MHTALKIMAVATMALSACAGPKVETKQATAELPTTEVRVAQVGDSWVSLNKLNGTQSTSSTVAVQNGIAINRSETDGCEWSREAGNPFAPSLTWSNCQGYTGQLEIVSTSGALLPLQVGATQEWVAKGTNEKGDTWDDVRTCTVVGTTNVTVPAGTYDAFHVECKGNNRNRTYYYAPEAGTNVIVTSTHKRRNEPWHWENISFTPASS